MQITLKDGVRLGDDTHHSITLRAPTAGDLIEAQAESERPVLTPEGYQLLLSHALMSAHVLRRQVARIGEDISGPMELGTLKRLSTDDLDLLHRHAEALDATTAREVERRGRPDGARGDSAPG